MEGVNIRHHIYLQEKDLGKNQNIYSSMWDHLFFSHNNRKKTP